MDFKKNNRILIPIFILGMLVCTLSCQPPKTKEAYLERFEKFVERVEENHKNYNQKDWEWADSQFKKFNGEWYLKFKGEYTFEDQIRIKGLILEYNSFKNNEDFGEIVKELFKEDVDEIKEKVEEYLDNDMDEDIDNLIEGGVEIGDSAIRVLEDIIEKFDNPY